MVNLTVSIPEELYRKMKKYSEVRWSEVVRKALAEYVGRLEVMERGIISSDKLSEMLDSKLDMSSMSLDKAVEHYEKSRELEWKRSSTIRARS
jgi:metal-responsive CopG/Arc/MetJ family transcriptional regulator